ncbi:hypothetical protein [Methylocystis parvus]
MLRQPGHHVTGVGSIKSTFVIKTWVFPPSMLLQYHFTQFGAFQPISASA